MQSPPRSACKPPHDSESIAKRSLHFDESPIPLEKQDPTTSFIRHSSSKNLPTLGKPEADEPNEEGSNRTLPLMYHLDASMQSMHLSDDEGPRHEESSSMPTNDLSDTDPRLAFIGSETPKSCVPPERTSSNQHNRLTSGRGVGPSLAVYTGSTGRQPKIIEQDAGFSDGEAPVAKVLTFSSDSESEKDASVTVLRQRNPQRGQGEPTKETQEHQPKDAVDNAPFEPEPEFGTGWEETAENAPNEPMQLDSGDGGANGDTEKEKENRPITRPSHDSGLEVSDLTQLKPRSRRRRRLSQRPQTVQSTTQSRQPESNEQQLMRTKLPLQVEYRFASDRKRRARRRRTLERTLGFPYQRPEYAVELQPYQNEAVEWMLDRERGCSAPQPDEGVSAPATTPARIRRDRLETKAQKLAEHVRGGILADEMGLGKTVCCVALICESLRMSREECRLESEASETPRVPRLKPPTLIITPLSILAQWEHELRSRTNLSVVSYQGATRKSVRTANEFMGVDVVLSTYDTLRLKECKVRPTPSNRRNQIEIDESDVDEEEEKEEEDAIPVVGGVQTTPWLLAARLTPAANRQRPRRRTKKVVSEVTSKLHDLAWHRVILDESHLITNASCARAQAAFSLKSSRRWCVTGTPVQNSSRDLTSLVQFLGVSPDDTGNDESETDSLLRALVPHVMLRRLKNTVDPTSRTPILKLPAKIEETRTLEFATDVERALYLLLHHSTKRTVLQYLSIGNSRSPGSARSPLAVRGVTTTTTKAPQFMHVFELILRLRQTCDACALVTSDPRGEVETRASRIRGIGSSSGPDTPSRPAEEYGELSSSDTAMLRRLCARTRHSDRGGFPAGMEELSTKIEALLVEIRAIKARGERALVVSQWTSFLDLIAHRLDLHNAYISSKRRGQAASSATNGASESEPDEVAVAYDTLDGRLGQKERDVVVQRFQRELTLDVLLLSLRTGGLGLNLTAASHVFIMEPSWNPSLESQAVDRAHRFGQRKPVRVVRFLMKSTIEERVVALQRKKQRLAAGLLGDPDDGRPSTPSRNGSGSLRAAQLTRQDLRELFESDRGN